MQQKLQDATSELERLRNDNQTLTATKLHAESSLKELQTQLGTGGGPQHAHRALPRFSGSHSLRDQRARCPVRGSTSEIQKNHNAALLAGAERDRKERMYDALAPDTSAPLHMSSHRLHGGCAFAQALAGG
jgi:hypothetical protein